MQTPLDFSAIASFSPLKSLFPLGKNPFSGHFPSEKHPSKHVFQTSSRLEITVWTLTFHSKTDMFCMNSTSSFKEILQEKMGHSSPTPSAQTTLNSTDPAHLAFLMGQLGRVTPSAPRKTYPRPSVRPVRKSHEFTPAQSQAFNFLKSWVDALNDNYNDIELKKAFRTAALILHPDKGGSTELFWELKTHHETLKQVLQKQPSI